MEAAGRRGRLAGARLPGTGPGRAAAARPLLLVARARRRPAPTAPSVGPVRSSGPRRRARRRHPSARGRRSAGRRSPSRPSRPSRADRPGERFDFGERTTLTSGPRLGVPLTSIRCALRPSALALICTSAVTTVPSRVVSISARSTDPTPAPSGTSAASTVPRGCLAPAARQVQVASSGAGGELHFDAMRHPADRLAVPLGQAARALEAAGETVGGTARTKQRVRRG